jgi:hypothetical protein
MLGASPLWNGQCGTACCEIKSRRRLQERLGGALLTGMVASAHAAAKKTTLRLQEHVVWSSTWCGSWLRSRRDKPLT